MLIIMIYFFTRVTLYFVINLLSIDLSLYPILRTRDYLMIRSRVLLSLSYFFLLGEDGLNWKKLIEQVIKRYLTIIA